jgi:hypothetical protein
VEAADEVCVAYVVIGNVKDKHMVVHADNARAAH